MPAARHRIACSARTTRLTLRSAQLSASRVPCVRMVMCEVCAEVAVRASVSSAHLGALAKMGCARSASKVALRMKWVKVRVSSVLRANLCQRAAHRFVWHVRLANSVLALKLRLCIARSAPLDSIRMVPAQTAASPAQRVRGGRSRAVVTMARALARASSAAWVPLSITVCAFRVRMVRTRTRQRRHSARTARRAKKAHASNAVARVRAFVMFAARVNFRTARCALFAQAVNTKIRTTPQRAFRAPLASISTSSGVPFALHATLGNSATQVLVLLTRLTASHVQADTFRTVLAKRHV